MKVGMELIMNLYKIRFKVFWRIRRTVLSQSSRREPLVRIMDKSLISMNTLSPRIMTLWLILWEIKISLLIRIRPKDFHKYN